jgi:hypothetical protein
MACAIPTPPSTHIFAVAGNASHFLYRNRKTVVNLERYAKNRPKVIE